MGSTETMNRSCLSVQQQLKALKKCVFQRKKRKERTERKKELLDRKRKKTATSGKNLQGINFWSKNLTDGTRN